MNPAQDSVRYGKTILDYTVIRTNRRTLEIAVHPDMSIVVRSPRAVALDNIRERVLKRADWLVRQRNHFLPTAHHGRTPRLYLNGATHRYLGKICRLKIIQAEEPEVTHSRGSILVMIKGRVSQMAVKSALDGWYRQRASILFLEVLEKVWPRFQKHTPVPPRMQIRVLKKRWGSLSPRRTLTLNLALIRAPMECIEYVIVHELCHLIHHDHGKGFYRLLEKMMPDWERKKRKLETGGF